MEIDRGPNQRRSAARPDLAVQLRSSPATAAAPRGLGPAHRLREPCRPTVADEPTAAGETDRRCDLRR